MLASASTELTPLLSMLDQAESRVSTADRHPHLRGSDQENGLICKAEQVPGPMSRLSSCPKYRLMVSRVDAQLTRPVYSDSHLAFLWRKVYAGMGVDWQMYTHLH